MYKGISKMDSGMIYAPYIPLQTWNEYNLVEIFCGINVIQEYHIKSLSDVKVQRDILCRVHGHNNIQRFITLLTDRTGYTGMHEEVYVGEHIPKFRFLYNVEETKPFLNCTEEEYLMFVLKYGQDFPQG